jgi:RNA recognition motif-containing protein
MVNKNIIVRGIPTSMKISEIASYFEPFGELMNIRLHEKSFKTQSKMIVFITFLEQSGAKRAIEREIIIINGHRVNISAGHRYFTKTNNNHKFQGNRSVNGHILGWPKARKGEKIKLTKKFFTIFKNREKNFFNRWIIL